MSLYHRCACASGFLKRFWGTVQWTVMAAATVAMFTVSLVRSAVIEQKQTCHALAIVPLLPKFHLNIFFTLPLSDHVHLFQVPFAYVEYDSHARLWPGVRKAYDAVDRYQLVNSYGLFRRMTGVGGRPEVVIEGSYDGVSWTVRTVIYVESSAHIN